MGWREWGVRVTSLALVAGCAAARVSVVESYDRVTSEKIVRCEDNYVSGRDGEFQVNPIRLGGAQPTFRFHVVYHRESPKRAYLGIQPGSRLTFLADGRRFAFVARRPGTQHTPFQGRVASIWAEEAYFDGVNEADLKFIAGAKSVEVRLEGADRAIEGAFSTSNFKAFRTFLAHEPAAIAVKRSE